MSRPDAPSQPPETSQEAARRAKPATGEQIVHLAVVGAGLHGRTADQIAALTGMPANSVQPRVWSLVRKGLLFYRKDEKRLTSHGRWAQVLVSEFHATDADRLFTSEWCASVEEARGRRFYGAEGAIGLLKEARDREPCACAIAGSGDCFRCRLDYYLGDRPQAPKPPDPSKIRHYEHCTGCRQCDPRSSKPENTVPPMPPRRSEVELEALKSMIRRA